MSLAHLFFCSCFKFWFGFSLVECCGSGMGVARVAQYLVMNFCNPSGKVTRQAPSFFHTNHPVTDSNFFALLFPPMFWPGRFVIWRLSLMNRASPSMAISSPELFGLCIGVVESPNPFIRLSLKKRGLWSSPLIRCKLRRWSADSSE